jgi:imidazolonepropionase-like amidohydrolase
MQAIQAATHWAAQSMDWMDVGTLQPGKLADIIVVESNPLVDIRAAGKVTLVLQEGRDLKHDWPSQ